MNSDPDKREILLAIDNLKSAILAKLESHDPLWLRLTQLALPVVLTSVLGLMVWKLQTGTQDALGRQQTILSAQLGLKQYLYQKRLDAYRDIYDKLLATYTSSRNMTENGPSKAKSDFYDELTLLSNLATANKLIASDELNELIVDAWITASRTGGQVRREQLIDCVVKQMRRDLLIVQDSPNSVINQASVQDTCNVKVATQAARTE